MAGAAITMPAPLLIMPTCAAATVVTNLLAAAPPDVPRRQCNKLLADALAGEADFAVFPLGEPIPGTTALSQATAPPV
jgi:hypothetical protein